MKTLTEIAIEKSRAGVYKDNPENRRLHRVGQRYGEPKKEELSANKQSNSLADRWSTEDLDTAANNSHFTFWKDGEKYAINSVERRNGKWISKMPSGEKKELSSGEVLSLIKEYDGKEGYKTSFYVKLKKGSSNASEKPSRTVDENKLKEDLAKVKAMSDEELVSKFLHYDAEKYVKADNAYKEAKSAFQKKWGNGLENIIDKISSIDDVEKLLKDSEALGEKLKEAQDNSPYTAETLQALRKRVNNKLKRGESLDGMNIGTVMVERERSFWKEKDFTAREGEVLARALLHDAASMPAKGDMGDLYWTEADIKKYLHKKLSVKEFNKLVKIVADHQGRQPRQQRGESTIGGYKDFERVMSNLDTEDGQPKGEKKGATDDSPKSGKAEETFTRVNLLDIPNSGKVNLKKYLSAKRKAAVDEAWSKAGDNLSPERLKQVYDGLVSAFNENFDSTPKAKRAENLYTILKVKNAIEKK